MAKDVILVAYANAQGPHLEKVKDEAVAIHKLLKKQNGDQIDVELIADADATKIWDFFRLNHKRIIAFHFAGHASPLGLSLEDGGKATNAALTGLIEAAAKKMKFVFLNGCATYDLVTNLLQAGVKCVIATSSLINDNTAYDFAMHFYSPLSASWTLGRAFGFAKSFVVTRDENGESFLPGLSRHIGIPDPNEASDLAWGIYYNPAFNVEQDGDEDLIKELADWTLPDSVAPLDVPVNYDPNYKLIETIANNTSGMAGQFEPEKVKEAMNNPQSHLDIFDLILLKKLYDEHVAGERENITALADVIIRLLPYPLGVLLRRMMSIRVTLQTDKEAENYLCLLNLQIQLYETLLRLYSYTMLSSLWDTIEKENIEADKIILQGSDGALVAEKKGISINKGQLEYLKSFFSITAQGKEEFDYASFARVMREILENNSPHTLIKEYGDVKHSFENREQLYQSHLFIQSLKYKLRNDKVNELLYPSLGSQMENELCNVFNTVFFILRYKLVVVKNIEIIKKRYPSATSYQHRRIILHRVNDSPLTEEEFNFPSHTDSYSVLFIRGRNDLKEYLSLSPFVIDKNALTGNGSSMLYFFSHLQNDAYVFECVDDPRKTMTIQEDQFDYLDNLPVKKFEINKIQKRFLDIKLEFQAFFEKVSTLKTI